MVLDSVLNPVFSPLLYLPYWLSILLLALMISVLVIFIYKKFTDQVMMKGLKEQLKQYQEEIKKQKQNPSKALSLQKQAMELNMKYMMHSMKPTLITFLPVILIFGWLNSHMAYVPLVAGQPVDLVIAFNEKMPFVGDVHLAVPPVITLLTSANQTAQNGTVTYRLTPPAGNYALTFSAGNTTYTKEILVVHNPSQKSYLAPKTVYKEGAIASIDVIHTEVKPFGALNIFGWNPGWLGTYIIFSLIFSISLRKLLKVY